MSELKRCPFCNCNMHINSNRDWHRLCGPHADDCFWDHNEEIFDVPATETGLAWLIRVWNTRTHPAEALPEPVAPVPSSDPYVYACPVGCGCLWRDNKDGTMSLFNHRQEVCEICEPLPLDQLMPLYTSEKFLSPVQKISIEEIKSAEPSPNAARVPDIDQLANFIRSCYDKNTLSAGLLAEKICGWLSATPPSSAVIEYPECSGNPADCPENEGYGCCKPNSAVSDGEVKS